MSVRLDRAGRAATLTLDRALVTSDGIHLDELIATEDTNEGVAALLEKRPAAWKHR